MATVEELEKTNCAESNDDEVRLDSRGLCSCSDSKDEDITV